MVGIHPLSSFLCICPIHLPLNLTILLIYPLPLCYHTTYHLPLLNFLIGFYLFKNQIQFFLLMNLEEGLVKNNNPKFGINPGVDQDEDQEHTYLIPKHTFHNFWIFILLLIFFLSFYFFLIFFRFNFKPLPSPWILLIFKTFFTSFFFILILFNSILFFPNFISFFIPFYGILDLLFLFFSSSLNEKITCILSFIFYIYKILVYNGNNDFYNDNHSNDQNTNIPLNNSIHFNSINIPFNNTLHFNILKQSCSILWSNFFIFTFIIFFMSLFLLFFSFIFMNLFLFSIPDRLLLYFFYFLSLYFYISLCTYALRIFTYNFIIFKNNFKSLKNTFYSLGSLSLYSFLDFIILEKKISNYFNFCISFFSSIREVSIQTPTYYLFFLIGTKNLPLSEALSKSKNYNLNQNLENTKKRINFFIILIGFVFMHFINLFYSETLKEGGGEFSLGGGQFCLGGEDIKWDLLMSFKDLVLSLKDLLFFNPHSGNIFTFFILIFSVSFFFSLFMISIYSGVVCLLILEGK